MKQDLIKVFAKAQASLKAEKATLEQRLAEINDVLGESPSPTNALFPGRGGRPARPKSQEDLAIQAPSDRATKPRQKSSKRPKNSLSLKAAILKVTAAKPLTKEEIFAAIQKLGYQFQTSKPMASINATVYSSKEIKRNGRGRFSPAN